MRKPAKRESQSNQIRWEVTFPDNIDVEKLFDMKSEDKSRILL